jgi:centromeric protein E
VRPLSKKELAVKDQSAWECADSQTILYKGPHQDRAAPTSYTFGTLPCSSNSALLWQKSPSNLLTNAYATLPDKVFGPSCQTDLVYEGGAKDVAMSALTGINGRLVLTF